MVIKAENPPGLFVFASCRIQFPRFSPTMLGIPSPVLAFSTALFALGTAYKGEELLIRDPGVYGPALEVVHLYWDQFPTGIAVSKNGRRFSNYPGALDPNNTYRGTEPKYTIAELLPNNTERAFPSVEMNSPVSHS
jgi:hypothetical protein